MRRSVRARLTSPSGLHAFIRKRGFDVIRWPVGTPYGVDFVALTDMENADVVVDVGANGGYFGAMLRARGYAGAIVSFEPGSSAFEQLTAQARADPEWTAHRLALGATARLAELSIPGGDTSIASLCAVNDRGKDHFADLLHDTHVETVEVVRLDDVWDDLISGDRAMVKLDTQGQDRAVLEGALDVMDRIVGIQTELSVNGYYEGAPDYIEMLEWLRDAGYEPVWFHPVSWHDGVLGELDCLLRRPKPGQPSPRRT
jgi:FkbM family methyltransferase